ncbi:MAG: hypothetical protein K2H22_09280, partial [Muribaculaceae bacterium]|nr:hypothetical protein [Muribaculaceae bacterium]
MKINIKSTFAAAVAVLSLASCSEGQYWTEPADKGQVIAFVKPAATISVGATATAPESYTVTLYRSQTAGDLEVPVTFSNDTTIFTAPSSVTFKNGENSAEYTFSIGSLIPGMTYTTKLGVKVPEGTITHPDSRNLSFTFTISQALTWTAAGEAGVISTGWVGNEEPVNVKVEEGNWPVAGERLFRLVDVYYTLEPEYAEPGTELRFYTDDAGNALRMASAWSYMGEMNDGEYCFFGCPAQYGCQFISDGNEYLMQGVVGTSASLT